MRGKINIIYFTILILLIFMLSGCTQLTVEEELVKAEEYFVNEDYEKSNKHYDNILEKEPDNIQAKLGLARNLSYFSSEAEDADAPTPAPAMPVVADDEDEDVVEEPRFNLNMDDLAIKAYLDIISEDKWVAQSYIGIADDYIIDHNYERALDYLLYEKQINGVMEEALGDPNGRADFIQAIQTKAAEIYKLVCDDMMSNGDITLYYTQFSKKLTEIYDKNLVSEDGYEELKNNLDSQLASLFESEIRQNLNDIYNDSQLMKARNLVGEYSNYFRDVEPSNSFKDITYDVYKVLFKRSLEDIKNNKYYSERYSPAKDVASNLREGYKLTQGDNRFVEDLFSFFDTAIANRRRMDGVVDYNDMISLMELFMEIKSSDELMNKYIEFTDAEIENYSKDYKERAIKIAKHAYEVTGLDKYKEFSNTKIDNKNTKDLNNRWDPVFNKVMDSVKGDYDGNIVQRIYGTVTNNLDQKWYNCQLTFALYDVDDTFINQINIYIGAADRFDELEFTTTTGDSIFSYRASKFELISVTPNVVR